MVAVRLHTSHHLPPKIDVFFRSLLVVEVAWQRDLSSKLT